MLGKIPASRLRLIERVVDRAGALLTRGQTARRGGNWAASASTLKPLLPKFIRHYYRGVAEDDLAARDVDDLAGAALWHLNAGLTRKPGTPWVHVCNPDAANEGYGSPHTVVAVVCDDMPFLVDSISMVLNQAGLSLQYIAHPILSVLRDRRGRLTDILEEPGEHGQLESWQFYEIDREADPAVIASLQLRLLATLGDVRAAVADWSEMRRRAREVAAHLEVAAHGKSGDVIEARDMLEWMDDNHFTFLGYRRYKLKRGRRSDKLEPAADSGLGILRIADAGVAPRPTIIEGTLREQARERDQMVITKANSLSTVHRAEYLDYVGIKIFDAKGEVAGEHRFLGLWTSSAYSLNPRDIPVLRNKLAKVIAHFGLSPTSHDGKALIHVLENFPRDELFQASVAELIRLARGVVNLYERQQVRLFLRRDAFHRFYSCLVYVPRDRYNTTVRQRLEGVLRDSLHGSAVDSQVQLSNSALARVHLLVRTSAQDDHRGEPRVDTGAIEARLAAATRTWADELEAALAAGHDEAATRQLVGRYVEAVPVAYHADTTPRAAVADIAELEALRAAPGETRLRLYRLDGMPAAKVQLKIYRAGSTLPISDAMPTIENLGLRLISERPYALSGELAGMWIQDFELEHPQGLAIDVPTDGPRLIEAIRAVWAGIAENDGFNRLILAANQTWRETALLRAYCRWLLQTGMPFSQSYMESVLAANARTANRIARLFLVRFDPSLPAARREREAKRLHEALEADLQKITRVDDDRILRAFRAAIDATLRTNFFQCGADGGQRPTIAFKIDPAQVPGLPEPRPMFEIWVYSPRVEAVHLRKGRVARGGIRWSDRREDFRTEVLGLMKAQNVKNTVIVPVGAKGGFVCKRLPAARDDIAREVVGCYSDFMRALLEITDNIVGGKIVPPALTVRRDADDPYLVVAADKGTATFSDTANAIAEAHGFWLGDAFASGGSAGYDHKKIAITARGAWECVKRHFRELGRDTQSQPFSVAAIGDMSGDVFGNGMLRSEQIRLVAAFNHQHIFIDPTPDAARSFAERQRLFALPRSSWDDYSRKAISAGGGVWSRQEKSISLPREARALLNLSGASATPTEIVKAILTLDVDLLWNGGIGTYVKASTEAHADVGDRANDAVRVDGRLLRAKIVGEGGNLGFSQLGRVEYALNGGRLNTDFIDNSGGVNCSDLEVNIKILLGVAAQKRGLRRPARDKLLAAMTDNVSALVLRNNYLQSQALSVLESRALDRATEHGYVIKVLERSGDLDRELENLPSDEALAERIAKGRGLSRPELSMVLSYSKIWLYNQLIASDVPEDRYLSNELERYFPDALPRRYGDLLTLHPLKREIIATATTNSLVNRMGPVFAVRAAEDTGAGVGAIARAYAIARECSAMREIWGEIEALDNRIPAETQYDMHYRTTRFLRHATYWVLSHRRDLDVEKAVGELRAGLTDLARDAGQLVDGRLAERIFAQNTAYKTRGVPERLAFRISTLELLYSGLDVVDIAQSRKHDLFEVARAYLHLGQRLDLDWLRLQIEGLSAQGHWQAVARNTLREGLYEMQRTLTDVALRDRPRLDSVRATDQWLATRAREVESLRRTVGEMEATKASDFATLSVALQSVRRLVGG